MLMSIKNNTLYRVKTSNAFANSPCRDTWQKLKNQGHLTFLLH